MRNIVLKTFVTCTLKKYEYHSGDNIKKEEMN